MKYFNLALSFITLFFILTAITKVSAQYALSDFIVAGCVTQNVAVYNSSLVYQRDLATSFGCAAGLDLMSNSNVVASSQNTEVRFYNPAGTLVSSFTGAQVGLPIDTKAYLGNVFIGTQDTNYGVSDFTMGGTFVRNLGTPEYRSGVAVLPGNILWAGGEVGDIDVFNISTGALITSIPLDNGQGNAHAMYYSPSTNTVLMTDIISNTVFERNTSGTFIRQFTGGASYYGVTRGPGGDVYSTDCFGNQIHRWDSAGNFIGSISTLPEVNCPVNIIWAGNTVVTAANVAVSGRVLTQNGGGLARATVTITDQSGNVRTAKSNSFGYYKFEAVESGATYTFGVFSKGYQFNPQVVTVNDNLTELNFTPEQGRNLK